MTAALALSPVYALDAQTLFITLGTGRVADECRLGKGLAVTR